ncbi:hypothetical protein N2152v2_005451 [Parachlorella kessleri]
MVAAALQSAFTRPAVAKAFKGTPLRKNVAVPSRGVRRVTAMKVALENIGSQYANALVEVAQAHNALEAVHTDVDSLAGVLKENKDVKDFLSNPTAKVENKKALIKRLASESGFNQYTVNFLNLLVDGNRIDAIDEICESFEVSYCALTDTQVATLRSAVKLEQEQQFLIAKKLQELTGSKNIKLKPVIDESLIAGFVVSYGSSQIDLSVKGQLDKISAELNSTAQAL